MVMAAQSVLNSTEGIIVALASLTAVLLFCGLIARYAIRSVMQPELKKIHDEVKSPNGTTTGVELWEAGKRQVAIQDSQVALEGLANAIAADMAEMKAEAAAVREELSEQQTAVRTELAEQQAAVRKELSTHTAQDHQSFEMLSEGQQELSEGHQFLAAQLAQVIDTQARVAADLEALRERGKRRATDPPDFDATKH